jgi:hypothetical protein
MHMNSTTYCTPTNGQTSRRFHGMARPEDFHSTVWQRSGEAKDWARTAWDYVELVDAGPDKVHFRVQFTRYRADGSAMVSYKSFYIVTKQNERWGIQGRSHRPSNRNSPHFLPAAFR